MAGVNLEIRKSGFDVTNPENAARCAHGTRGKRGRWNHSRPFVSLRGCSLPERFLGSILLIRAIRKIRGELRGVRDGLPPSPDLRRTSRRKRRPSQPRHGPRRAAAATPSPPLFVCHRDDPWLLTRGAVRKRRRPSRNWHGPRRALLRIYGGSFRNSPSLPLTFIHTSQRGRARTMLRLWRSRAGEKMGRPTGFEPATPRSILPYGRML